MGKVYIAFDVECSGNRLGIDNVLSLGACVVPNVPTGTDWRYSPLSFYVEFRPLDCHCEAEALRVGCSGLSGLKHLKQDPQYNPSSDHFAPGFVMAALLRGGEEVPAGIRRLEQWLQVKAPKGTEIVPVVDTVFYDAGWIQYLFGVAQIKSPLGWGGLDLDSLYRGYTGRMDASLRELNLPDTRQPPHHAREDAIFLAQIAREVFNLIGSW